MLEPRALCSSVPMLNAFGDVDDVACVETNGRFAPFLIDAFATDADEYLMCSVMDVPVVAATRFECHVGITLNGLLALGNVLWLDRREVTVACEILSVSIVRVALWPRACTGVRCSVALRETILA